MLGSYFASVLIYMIAISCMCFMFKDQLKSRGWASNQSKKQNRLVVLFCLSAVPVIRLMVVVVILYMAVVDTKDEYDAKMREFKKNR